MQFTFELDIHDIIAKATDREKIEPLLDKAITEAIKSAINDATGYRSPFSESLKTQLKEAMPSGLHIADIAKFQQVFNAEITKAVHGANAATVHAALAQVSSNVMPDVPERLKLSELMQMAREGFHKEEHEAFFAELEASEYGSTYIYLDSDENPGSSYSKGKNGASIRLSLNKEGDVYAMKFNGVDMTPTKTPNVISKFDGILMCMYTGRTMLEVDMDEDDVKAAAEASYDD
jgi:hypothetical protein